MLLNLAYVLIAVAAAEAWFLVIRYLRVDWRATDAGRFIMGLSLMLAVTLTLTCEVRIFGPFPGIQVVGVLIYAWLVYLLGALIRLMLRANRKPR